MHIRTTPVYSRLADTIPDEVSQKLPTDWQLSQHQVETYKALMSGDHDVIFNTAITGDGKSLAGQLPALVRGWQHAIFAMYPTNELIRDQERQVQNTWSRWHQRPFLRSVDSSQLDAVMETKDFGQRGEALQSLMANCDLLLTNPDIFHYVMEFFYIRKGKQGDAPDKIIGDLVKQFQQFTFDEFHIFETPQMVSVLNAILLIHAMQGKQRSRFLFQSATPNPMLEMYLQRSGLNYMVIEGEYQHNWQNPDPTQWRRILQGSDIHFSDKTAEEWIEAHLEDTLLPFFLQRRPAAKGAIIVNSVAQAKRLYAALEKCIGAYQLTVGENTGLTSRTKRIESRDCDLLVGTSTVDVGIDFQINFLLFESRDAGSFLQRLGRLGRHVGYERNGQQISFDDHFEAHALLPRWTLERLFQGGDNTPPPLANGAEIDRQALTLAIKDAFPPPADFARYAQRWGGLQSANVISHLRNPTVRSTYDVLSKALMQQYNNTFQISVGSLIARLKQLQQDKQQKPLWEEAIAFRGGSYFTCGVLDISESGADQIKTYDLFALIANVDLDPLAAADFWATVDVMKLARQPIEHQQPLAYFRLRGFRAERTRYWVMIDDDLAGWGADRFGVVTVLQGITVETEFAHEIPGLNAINQRLERERMPALICAGNHPLELKRKLQLPLLFPLYELRSRDGVAGSIAFGREALLLDVALQHRGIHCGGGAIFL